MKILIFSQYYYPEQFLINEITKELVKQGHKLTVVTGKPNYPSGVIEKEYRYGKKKREIIEGIEVIRCPIIPRGRNKIQLILNYISYMLSANFESRKLEDKYDVVMSYQLTPIFQVYPAIKYAKRNKLKLLIYNLDLAPMSGSLYAKKKEILYTLYAKFSSWIMNSCDVIAVTSESFIEYNHKINNVPVEKMVYLPQHASAQMMDCEAKSIDNQIVDFMFAGNIAGGTGIDTIVNAAKKLKEELDFRVHIVGDGSYLKKLKENVKKEELSEYFVFHGRHPMNEMSRFYQLADALLITLRPGQITIPGKLQTYMSSGKPVFGAMDGSGKDLINKSGCGVCVSAGDSVALYEKMKEYIVNPDKYKQCGERGLQYYEKNFTLDIFVNRLMEILSNLV